MRATLPKGCRNRPKWCDDGRVSESVVETPLTNLDVGPDDKVEADEAAQRTFSRSILISAVRCTLTYVFFPFVAPLIGLSSRIGPTAGVVIGVIAIVANLFSIRRFHRADHKWKWHMTTLNVAVIGLLVILLFIDVGALLS